jgi:calcineurin-like phosphoesterase family protein
MKIKLQSAKQQIYFTSDTHYNHSNIIKSISKWEDLDTAREGFDSIDKMNETIINNINEIVEPNDVLFHLGDVAFGKNAVIEFRNRINCKTIHLILGNHDKEIDKQQSLKSLFSGVYRLLDVKIDDQDIVLCHYAMRTFKKSHHGAIHLYGHSHGQIENTDKSMDVGLDNNKFYPFAYSEILELLPTFKKHSEICSI